MKRGISTQKRWEGEARKRITKFGGREYWVLLPPEVVIGF
jgi:hypothetical protein